MAERRSLEAVVNNLGCRWAAAKQAAASTGAMGGGQRKAESKGDRTKLLLALASGKPIPEGWPHVEGGTEGPELRQSAWATSTPMSSALLSGACAQSAMASAS